MRTLTLGNIPVRTLRSHPVRAFILLLLAFTQAACLFGSLNLVYAMQQELSLTQDRLGADILIYPAAAMSRISSKALLMQGSPVEVWKHRSTLSRMDDCEGIEAVAYHLYIRDTTGETPVWITGFDPALDFVITPWLRDPISALPDGAVLAGCRVATNDNSITLFSQRWPVAGVLHETESELDEMVTVNSSNKKYDYAAYKKTAFTTVCGSGEAVINKRV